jgi:hypothetical protein
MTDGQYRTNGQGGRLGTLPYRQSTGNFVSALQDAVRENPISAALIGMGVLWLFAGGSNTSLFGGGGRKAIFRTGASYTEQAGGTANGAGSSMRRVADNGAAAVSQVAGAVRQASSALGDAASRTGTQAADSLSSAYKAATDIASQSTAAVANTTSTAARALQEKGTALGTAAQQNLSDLFERRPLLLGAAGLAIGASIAASIRTTEAEKRTFGKASDLVRDTVAEKAAEVKEMADAALKEAEAQGLTPHAAGEVLRVVGDKIAPVASGKQSDRKRGGPGSVA